VISGFAERTLLLAILVVGALAIVLYPQRPKPHKPAPLPVPVPAPGGSWYDAVAGSNGGVAVGARSKCGQIVSPEQLGVAYAGLPCGAKIYVKYRDRQILTQVVDQGPYVPGRQFDFTPALARKLGLKGTQRVQWRFAQPR
jgi:hypothetical protein